MNIEIDIHDYLSEEEIAEECRYVVGQEVREKLRTEEDIHRFMSNSSYHFVWDAVDELCPENMRELIAAKIPEIVNELATYCVFRPKDVWDREESKGWTILQSVLSESKPLIEKRVHELIQEFDLREFRDVLDSQIENVIDNLKEKSDTNA